MSVLPRRALSVAAAAADAQLLMFSEFREAERLFKQGRPDMAEPQLRRTVDVCAAIPGAVPLVTAARRRCACFFAFELVYGSYLRSICV